MFRSHPPLWSRRPRWYAVYGALARVLLLWVTAVVILTPAVPVPATREPQRAILRNAWAVAGAAAATGAFLAVRERRRSIRKQYAISAGACAVALLVGLLGYPPHVAAPAPVMRTTGGGR